MTETWYPLPNISVFPPLSLPSNDHSTFFFYDFDYFIFHIWSKIIQCLYFCVWFIWFSTVSSRLIQFVTNGRVASTLKAEYYLYILGILKMLQWIGECRYFFKIMILFLLDITPEAGLLDHKVVLFLIFWETFILFSIMAVPIYILMNSVQRFPFLHILGSTGCLLSFKK